MLSVDALEGFTAGRDQLPFVLRAVRERLIQVGGELDEREWRASSRCELWTVHDVFRHIRDGCQVHLDTLRDGMSSSLDEPFDSRETPLRWLAASDGESPETTLAELEALAAAEAEVLGDRLTARYTSEVVPGPYGPVHWTVLTSHVLWDTWLHEGDVTEPLGRARRSPPAEEAMIALYSLLIASMPAALQGRPLAATVSLAAEERRYVASVAPGRVALRLAEGKSNADLLGDLVPVVNALAGRGEPLDRTLAGDPAVREPFTWLAAMLRPQPWSPL